MSRRLQFIYWGSAALTAACLLALSQNQAAALVIHFLTGKFLYSTSNGAALFFLSLFMLSAVVAACVNIRQVTPKSPVLSWTLVCSLLTGTVVNLISFYLYKNNVGLHSTSRFYHWLDGQNSFSFLLHNHTGKTALAFLANLFSLDENLHRFDMGQVFLLHVPTPVTVTVVVFLVLSLLLFLLCLPNLLARYNYHYGVFLLIFLSFSSCLKSMVDGGFLTYRFLPSLLVLISLVMAKDCRSLLKLWRGFWGLVFIVATVPLIILWQSLAPEQGSSAFAPFLFLLTTYVTLFLLLLSASWKKNLAIATLSLYLFCSSGFEYVLFDGMLFNKITAGQQIIKVDYNQFSVENITSRYQDTPLYKVYLGEANDPLKPKNIFIWNPDEPGLNSMSFISKGLQYAGQSGALPEQKLLTFSSTRQLPSDPQALQTTMTTAAGMPPIFSSQYATLLSRNNHYCYLHLLGNLWTASGIREFILIPLEGSDAQ